MGDCTHACESAVLVCACAPLALTSLKEMAPLASVSICLNSSFSAFGSIGIDNAPKRAPQLEGRDATIHVIVPLSEEVDHS